MLTAIVCLVTLAAAPADAGALEIINARPTFGHLGPMKVLGKGVLPGEVAHFRFDVKNLSLDKNGRASYSLLVEVEDDKGQPHFRLGPINSVAQNSLGGNLMPCTASMEVPPETPPGIYTMKVTITDRLANKSTTLATKGKVLPADFGIVRVGTFADREGKLPMPALGILGETLFIDFAAVGFERDKQNKQPDLKVSMTVLDEKGNPAAPVPQAGRANQDIPDVLKLVPMQFGLTLNRVGTFTVVLSATDQLSGKSAEVRLPLRVVPPTE